MQLYIANQRRMCDLLFSSDHLNYAKYLPLCNMTFAILDKTHPGARKMFEDGGLSVARSSVTCSRIPVDQTIEQTINRSAQTRGGIIGFSRNVGAYYRWCVTRHKRTSYLEATLEELDMISDENDSHKTTKPSAIRQSEEEVSKVINAFKQYMDPFDLDRSNYQQLFCLSSGQPASEDIEKDGEAAVQKIHDKYIKKVDELFGVKEKEIMTV